MGVGYSALPDGVGRGEQILIQLAGIVGTAVWSFVATSIILLALKYTIGLRVEESTEQLGLDVATHGEGAYTN